MNPYSEVCNSVNNLTLSSIQTPAVTVGVFSLSTWISVTSLCHFVITSNTIASIFEGAWGRGVSTRTAAGTWRREWAYLSTNGFSSLCSYGNSRMHCGTRAWVATRTMRWGQWWKKICWLSRSTSVCWEGRCMAMLPMLRSWYAVGRLLDYICPPNTTLVLSCLVLWMVSSIPKENKKIKWMLMLIAFFIFLSLLL